MLYLTNLAGWKESQIPSIDSLGAMALARKIDIEQDLTFTLILSKVLLKVRRKLEVYTELRPVGGRFCDKFVGRYENGGASR